MMMKVTLSLQSIELPFTHTISRVIIHVSIFICLWKIFQIGYDDESDALISGFLSYRHKVTQYNFHDTHKKIESWFIHYGLNKQLYAQYKMRCGRLTQLC